MKPQPLTVIARIVAKEGKKELVKNELLKLIRLTRAEKGCINYDLHQDQHDEHLFLFYENWASRELWLDHMEQAHLANFKTATEGAIEKIQINEMILIDN